MCMYTRRSRTTRARRDITVYKVLCRNHRGELLAPLQNFEYQRERKYELGKEIVFQARAPFEDGDRHGIKEIHEGFHSFRNRAAAFDWRDSLAREVVYRATIPKGARYTRSMCGREFVSDAIIIHDQIIPGIGVVP